MNDGKPLFGVAKHRAEYSGKMDGNHDLRGRMLRPGRRTEGRYATVDIIRFFIRVPSGDPDDMSVDKFFLLDCFALDEDGKPIAQPFELELREYFLKDGHTFSSADELIDFDRVTSKPVCDPRKSFQFLRGVGNERAGKEMLVEIRITNRTDFSSYSPSFPDAFDALPAKIGIRGAGFQYHNDKPPYATEVEVSDLDAVMKVAPWL